MLRTLGFNWNRRSARHANRSKSYNTFNENGECRSMEYEVFDPSLLDVSTNSGDIEADSEEVIRTKLRWHYMNPYQKFKLRKRKPWKLLLQILKIILVTAQVLLFGNDRFAQVSFYDDNTQAFYDIFLEGNTTDFSLFVIPDVYISMMYAHKQYYMLEKAIGSYSIKDDNNEINSMLLITKAYTTGNITANSYSFNTRVVTSKTKLLPPLLNKTQRSLDDFVFDNNITNEFDSLIYFKLNFNIRTIHLKELKPSDKPDCINFNITILYDNARHDGRIFVSLTALPTLFKCSGTIDGRHGEMILRNTYILYDCVVIIICIMSFSLCLRSVIKHLHLAKKVGMYFQQQLSQALTISDYVEFINMWFILIILSDVLTISGSICKILIDIKIYDDYNVCSLFLGLGVLMVWIGLLRYLTYLKKYNILLVTLKASAPSVLRFCLCAAVLYFGFTFCGWIVLGPYHPKFRDIFTVSECLFSLLNGDDMFMTFKEMQKRSYAAWIFSKIYLYTFISLFIYVVLSLFIGIISDTYERMKDWGHPPCSRLQRFVHGVQCSRCRSEQGLQDEAEADQTPKES